MWLFHRKGIQPVKSHAARNSSNFTFWNRHNHKEGYLKHTSSSLSSLTGSHQGPPSNYVWLCWPISRSRRVVYRCPCRVGQATCSEGGLDTSQKIVNKANAHWLTQSDFQCDITFSTWRPWWHLMQKSADIWWVHVQHPLMHVSSVCQLPASTSV